MERNGKGILKNILIAFILVLSFVMLSLSVFSHNESLDVKADAELQEFLDFEKQIVSLNSTPQTFGLNASEAMGTDEYTEEMLVEYCENNDSYYVKNEEGYSIYSDFALKRLIVQGDVKDTYGAISSIDYNDLHVLTYGSESDTEYAYNKLSEKANIDVFPSRIESVTDYVDNEYDYSEYLNYGAEAAQIGGYREYLSDVGADKEEAVAVVMDTGINTAHEMFQDRLLKDDEGKIIGYSYFGSAYQYSYDNLSFEDDDTNKYSFEDDGGHGSHCAGIICNLTPSNVKILPIKISIVGEGVSYSETMIAAYLRVLNVYSKQYNIVSVNLSFSGAGKQSESQRNTFNTQCYIPLKNAGILCSTSAGNSAYTNNLEGLEAVVVSSVAESDDYYEIANYSDRGKIIDITAPGSRIYSAVIGNSDVASPKVYAYYNGTSMASPQVAGIIALLKLDPSLKNLSAWQLEQKLYDYAVEIGEQGKDTLYGNGLASLKYFESDFSKDTTLSFYCNGVLEEIEEYKNFENAFNLTINCSDPEFQIIYTSSSHYPTLSNSTLYDGGILVTDTISLTVMGVKIEDGEIVEHTLSYKVSYFNTNGDINDYFTITSSGTLENYTGHFNSIVIPQYIDGVKVQRLGESLFEGDLQLEHVEMLTTDYIHIYASAFYGCSNLRYFNGPGVNGISGYAFTGCDNLPFVTNDVPEEGSTEGVYLPKVSLLNNRSFYMCSGLEYAKLNTVKNFTGGAAIFYGCTKLRSVELQNVTSTMIGDWCFYGCPLEKFTIWENVTTIGEAAFGQNKLETLTVKSDNFYCDGRALYGESRLIAYLCGTTGDYSIKESVETQSGQTIINTIDVYAFEGATISELTIPNTITIFGKNAISFCNIEKLYYNAGVSTADSYTEIDGDETKYYVPFYQTTIKDLIVGEQVEILPAKLFASTYLTNVHIMSVNTDYEEGSLNAAVLYSSYLEFTDNPSNDWLTTYHNVDRTIYYYFKVELTSSQRNQLVVSYIGIENGYYKYNWRVGFYVQGSAGEGGIVESSIDAITASLGTSVTFTIIPDDKYYIKDVFVNDVSVGAVDSYTVFVDKTYTIYAEFDTDFTYTITSNTSGYGTITETTTAKYNTGKTFIITPNRGHCIKDVLVDGVSVGAVESYTFTNITQNHTIMAEFENNSTYTIFSSCDDNGTISPLGETSVNLGGEATYTITPNEGCIIKDVLVDGQSIGVVSTYTFEDVSSNHTIKAIFIAEAQTYTTISSCNEGGKITPLGTSVNLCTDSITYTITPNPGYYIKEVLINGVNVGQVYTYTFSEIAADSVFTIEVVFAIKTFTVKSSVKSGEGTISPNGTTTVNYNETIEFDVVPATGYYVEKILVNGYDIHMDGSFTMTGIKADYVVEVYFAKYQYTMTINISGGGTVVSNTGSNIVGYGEDIQYTITPNDGYYISDVSVDGIDRGAVSTLSFVNVISSHTINVKFLKYTYAITEVSNEGGTIELVNGTNPVEHGNTVSYKIVPNEGYYIDKLLVDGASMGSANSYIFTNVTGDHTIEAQFKKYTYNVSVSANSGGTITTSREVGIVEYGEIIEFTITPNEGYIVFKVYINGFDAGSINTHTAVIVEDFNIEVIFSEKSYTVYASKEGNGKVTPAGVNYVKYLHNITLSFVPDSGYYIKSVSVDNVLLNEDELKPIRENGYYILEKVKSNHRVNVVFGLKTLNITFSSTNDNVSVSAVDSIDEVTYGKGKKFSVDVDLSKYNVEIYVNGVLMFADVDSFELAEITEDTHIEVKTVKKSIIETPSGIATIVIAVSAVAVIIFFGLKKSANSKQFR